MAKERLRPYARVALWPDRAAEGLSETLRRGALGTWLLLRHKAILTTASVAAAGHICKKRWLHLTTAAGMGCHNR